MDGIDRKILSEVQSDGRITITDLAARVGLSVSPTHRRLRELEKSGAIRGYRAVVDPDALGLTFEVLVFVTMKQEDRDTLLEFEAALNAIPNVLQAQRLFGDPDYLVRVRTADLPAYAELEDNVLAVLPGIQRLNSTLVMKHVVTDRAVPV
ncbi:Lrp/AsnC family transcriptional regulator [Nocardiopsis chromatogenes]|uniref:Lrp/AsnC family transcriptional regulator n=1 Tax=Nocardiopsis chromatogenes TaxID=280239 RepID=UPI00034502ED|nr:Lrp/AsnC family transcriptional regulator [Nocardiopsis chromatogenes]